MRILSFVSFLLVGAAYGSPVAQPACLTLETKDLCHFPFNYKGVIYDKCTYVETINNKPWCATVPEVNITREGKVLFKSQFGDCDLESNCEVEVEVEDCSEDTCTCHRDYKPVCAEDGEVYDNLCEYQCAKKKAACESKRGFPELVECNSSSQLGYISKFNSKQKGSRPTIDSFVDCKFKKCGELCETGVCNGDGFCVNPLENPCVQHGCGGKSCGEECLSGDIVGSCDIDGDCDFYSDRAINSCDKQDECQGKPCGEMCRLGECNGYGFCVSPLENPCEQHGCHGKSCGDDCLLGDILGICDIKGYCDSFTRKAIESCNQQVEDCSEDACQCHRDYKPVCAEDGKVYGNLCEYQCAKKKAACGGIKREFPELEECNSSIEDCSEDTCQCPRLYKPVCAEDGEVYDNLCEYQCAKKKATCGGIKRGFPELEGCNF